VRLNRETPVSAGVVSDMPAARKIEKVCPRCDDDSEVWMFEKQESALIKEHYTCDSCGYEWTERRQI